MQLQSETVNIEKHLRPTDVFLALEAICTWEGPIIGVLRSKKGRGGRKNKPVCAVYRDGSNVLVEPTNDGGVNFEYFSQHAYEIMGPMIVDALRNYDAKISLVYNKDREVA